MSNLDISLNKINLYDLFKIDDNTPFVILTNDNKEKICILSHGVLLEDVGYKKGQYYSTSYIGINDIAGIKKLI